MILIKNQWISVDKTSFVRNFLQTIQDSKFLKTTFAIIVWVKNLKSHIFIHCLTIAVVHLMWGQLYLQLHGHLLILFFSGVMKVLKMISAMPRKITINIYLNKVEYKSLKLIMTNNAIYTISFPSEASSHIP